MKAATQPKRIAIAVPPNAQSLDVFGPLDVFVEATRQSGGAASYDMRLVAIEKDLVIRTGGASLLADKSIYDSDAPYDTLLVAGSPDFSRADSYADFQQWLRQRVVEVPRYGSVCTGAFFLGAAGFLDGRNVTTHWQHAAELAARYPAAKVEPDQIYVKDGCLYTTAGVTAGIDLALVMIEEDFGKKMALDVAQDLIVYVRRWGGQSQFSPLLETQAAADSQIQPVQQYLLDNLHLPHTMASLAQRLNMSARNLSRIFSKECGVSLIAFLNDARIDAARRYLESTDHAVSTIARRCGFE